LFLFLQIIQLTGELLNLLIDGFPFGHGRFC
jgi:hypothetical protein